MAVARKTGMVALALVLGSHLASARDLAVVGTGDGIEMLRSIGVVFNAHSSDLAIAVPPSIGSGGAVAAVGAERNVLGRIARPLTDQEKAQGLRDIPLVRIPSAFFVHPSSGVGRLTADEVAGIYTGRIENWRELGGADLKIKVVRREESDSTLAVLRGSMPGWKDLVLTTKSKLATTTQEAVDTVKSVPGAIGFGPYSRALEDGATVLAIDGRHPLDGDYPSAVTLSLLYKDGKLDEGARDFIEFAGSESAKKVMVDFGGIPLTK